MKQEYCACRNKPPVYNDLCIACGLPRYSPEMYAMCSDMFHSLLKAEGDNFCRVCGVELTNQHPNTNKPYTYPRFKVGDKVVDMTAEANGWPDVEGEIIQVDGSNIKVRYTSGNERWKLPINIRYK